MTRDPTPPGSPSAKPIVVDDVRYSSAANAARALGFEIVTFRTVVSMGKPSYLGHELEYPDGTDDGYVEEKTFLPKVDDLLERRRRVHYGGLLPRVEVSR